MKHASPISRVGKLSKELCLLLFLIAVVVIFKPARAHAATFDVGVGNYAVNDGDNVCQLAEAIENINSGSRTYADCVESGAYGTNDTINLPVGTITGPGSQVSAPYNSTKFLGKGRGQTILNNLGLYIGSGQNYTVKDLTMTNAFETSAWGTSLDVDNVEINLNGHSEAAIRTSNSSLTVQNSYLHNAWLNNGSGQGLITAELYGSNNITVERTTFSRAVKGIQMTLSGSGLMTATASVKNSTFTDMVGLGGTTGSGFFTAATGISTLCIAYNPDEAKTLNYSTINNTFSNMTNSDNGFVKPAAIREISVILGSGISCAVNHTTQNNIYAVGNGNGPTNYNRFNVADNLDLIGSGSAVNGAYNTTSNGGNISSDSSFSSYLTNPKDKHNQTSLASFLGVLTDNGGPAPTLALLEGSPAIDAGTNVLGMTTDQRGASRPQGTAFDAGAYESAFAAQVSGNAGEKNSGGTLANTGTLAISSTLLIGIILSTFAYSFWDYRRHKQPLIEVDPNARLTYTYLHHVKVVTIPLIKYRINLSIARNTGADSIHKF